MSNVVIDEIVPSHGDVTVTALEGEPTEDAWSVTAYAICANVS